METPDFYSYLFKSFKEGHKLYKIIASLLGIIIPSVAVITSFKKYLHPVLIEVLNKHPEIISPLLNLFVIFVLVFWIIKEPPKSPADAHASDAAKRHFNFKAHLLVFFLSSIIISFILMGVSLGLVFGLVDLFSSPPIPNWR